MHRGAGVRLGQHERLPARWPARAPWRSAWCMGALGVRRAGSRDQCPAIACRPLPRLVGDQLVLAVAEEGEVVVARASARNCLGLVDLLGLDRRRRGRARRSSVLVRSRIGCQSSTAARTSASTRSMFSRSCCSAIAVGLPHDLHVQNRLGHSLRATGALLEHLEQPPVVVTLDPDHRMDDQVDP